VRGIQKFGNQEVDVVEAVKAEVVFVCLNGALPPLLRWVSSLR
jgi:hypothetical protein